MAKSSTSRVATISDVQRAVAQASVSRTPKKQRSNKRNSGGSSEPPVAIGSTLTNRGPTYASANRANTRIRNTEFVADVASTSTGSVISFDLNPISGSLFTWLARIANGYELFRFHKLEFTYTPICTTSTQGVVVMAFDYDASDAAPNSKQALSGYSGSKRTNVWNKLSCALQPPSGWFYVGQGGSVPINPSGTDVKFYDIAKFYLGIFNATGASTVGELVVTYDVEFSKPDFTNLPVVSESLSFSGSTLTNLPGTNVVAGQAIATLTQNGTNGMMLNFNIPGRYIIEILSQSTANAAMTNAFNTPTQTDPGALPVSVGWLDYVMQGWVSASASVYGMNLMIVTALTGTSLLITASTAATNLNLIKMRLAPYALLT